jgi:hypothetical protein
MAALIRHHVDSGTISAVSYDFDAQVLLIEFHRGGAYRYYEVPELIFRRLLSASSKGAFFNSSIANRFRAEQVSHS